MNKELYSTLHKVANDWDLGNPQVAMQRYQKQKYDNATPAQRADEIRAMKSFATNYPRMLGNAASEFFTNDIPAAGTLLYSLIPGTNHSIWNARGRQNTMDTIGRINDFHMNHFRIPYSKYTTDRERDALDLGASVHAAFGQMAADGALQAAVKYAPTLSRVLPKIRNVVRKGIGYALRADDVSNGIVAPGATAAYIGDQLHNNGFSWGDVFNGRLNDEMNEAATEEQYQE